MISFCILEAFLQAMIAAMATYPQLFLRNLGYSQSVTGVVLAIGQGAGIVIPVIMASVSDKFRCDRLCIIVCCILSMMLRIPMLGKMSVVLLSVVFFFAEGLYSCANPLGDGLINKGLSGKNGNYSVIRSVGTMGYVVTMFAFALFKWPVETDNNSIILCQCVLVATLVIATLIQPKNRTDSSQSKNSKFFDKSWFNKEFYIFFSIAFISRIAESVVDKLLPSYLTEYMGLGSSFTAFIALGALSEFAMLAFGQKLKLKSRGFLLIASIGLFVRLIIYNLTSNLFVFALAQLLHSLCFGAHHIACTRFITENVAKEHYSIAMSLYWAIFTNLPIMLGTFAGGFIIDWLGYKSLFLIYSIFPAISSLLIIKFRRRLA